MFAPAPAVDANGAAVPYVTTLSPYGAQVLTTSAVIDSCIAELITAQSLLSTSDVTTTRFTTWGVQGLLARIYLYKGDLANARNYAMGLINSKQFPLSGNNTDLTFQKEHVFSLYNNSSTINTFYRSVLSSTPPLAFTLAGQTTLFVTGSGSTGDWRKTFNDAATGLTTGTLISPRKCWGNTNNILPMIRMTEMYYIAAESASALLDSVTATNLMDTVRVHRNLAKYAVEPLKRDSLTVEIGKEYQKEFLSEGQVFYYYKRRNLPFSALPFTRVQPVAGASYVFIKPE
jgi:hypothetical protein